MVCPLCGKPYSIRNVRVIFSVFRIVRFFKRQKVPAAQGCARFPEFVQNFSEHQILWSLCSVDFHTLTLQLPIQTPHSVAPELQVFMSSLEKCQNFSKTSTPQVSGNRDFNHTKLHGSDSFKRERRISLIYPM